MAAGRELKAPVFLRERKGAAVSVLHLRLPCTDCLIRMIPVLRTGKAPVQRQRSNNCKEDDEVCEHYILSYPLVLPPFFFFFFQKRFMLDDVIDLQS